LHGEGRLRVWSLVITVMGDVAQPHGGQIPFPVLQSILERLGVEPGALRTAMSRLVADGWLVRDRMGRTSHYALSAQGLAEYGPAAARIYATAPAPPESWTIALVDGDSAGIPLTGGFCLFPGPAPDRAVIAVEGPLHITDEAGGRFLAAGHRAALERLANDLDVLNRAELAPLDAIAARVLLIHRWRRIVLRYDPLPDCLMPAACADLHDRVAAAYRRLLAASELWLKSGTANGFTAQDAADSVLQQRFVRD
jgi:phenylacetic acid degradation operon negative regulatory protein